MWYNFCGLRLRCYFDNEGDTRHTLFTRDDERQSLVSRLSLRETLSSLNLHHSVFNATSPMYHSDPSMYILECDVLVRLLTFNLHEQQE